MINLGPHAVYIISSYAGVTLVICLTIVWVWIGSKKQNARLADLDTRGIHRRSDNTDDQKTDEHQA